MKSSGDPFPTRPQRERAPALRQQRRAAALLALAALLSATPSAALCTGDCNHDRAVTINELLSGVNISLGGAEMSTCADFDRNRDDRLSIDELIAGVTAALQGCGGQSQAFVLTSDFFTGSYGTIGLDPPRDVSPASPRRRVHRDSVVRTHDGLVYVVNRLFGDNLQVLDPARDFATQIQCSTGNATNPHDIAFAGPHKAYMTLFEKSELLIVDPATDPTCKDFVLGSIDLRELADADGIPDMDQMALVGDRLYVALQRLDINTVLRLPATNGALAVIDTATDALIGSIELTGENPFGATKGLTVRDGAIYVAEAGLFGVMDGGIERVDLAAQRADGFMVSEADLGGDITDFVLIDDHLAYAIISRPDFSNALIAFDPSSRSVTQTMLETAGFTLFDLELNDRGELFLADRTRRAPGVRIYRASDGTPLTDGILDLVLPPFEIVFIP